MNIKQPSRTFEKKAPAGHFGIKFPVFRSLPMNLQLKLQKSRFFCLLKKNLGVKLTTKRNKFKYAASQPESIKVLLRYQVCFIKLFSIRSNDGCLRA